MKLAQCIILDLLKDYDPVPFCLKHVISIFLVYSF